MQQTKPRAAEPDLNTMTEGAKRAGAKRKKADARRKPATSRATPPGAVKAQRPYPQRTLEEALQVPQAIREKNNGHPWDTENVAQAALGVSKTNNKFFYAAAASRDYGLTIGSRDTERIELTETGRAIVFAGDPAVRRQKQIEAFISVDIFKRVFEHYGGSSLPEQEFLSNTLQGDFGLQPEFHEEFARLFRANCKFLGIEGGLEGSGAVVRDDQVEHPSDIRVVGEPKGKFDRRAFVVMPFVEKGPSARAVGFFNEVLTTLITPAANAVGFAVETAQQDGSDVIQSTIIGQLLAADLVIADLSDHNPNVLFELGIRIAKDLPVALVKADGTGRIFDVDNMMRVFTYSPNLWSTTVARDVPRLSDHIKAAWDNRSTARSYIQILTGSPPA